MHLHDFLKENGQKLFIGLYHKRHHYLLNTLLKEFHSQLSMRRLQREERQRAVGMLENGAKQRVVAQRFNVSQSVISRLWARYRQTQNVDDRPRSGRPRATTQAQDRLIRTFTLRNRTVTARQIASHLQDTAGVRVTGQTIRNRLHARGLKARRPYVTPMLTARHIRDRRQWCEQRRHWGNRRWARVMFSDESRFTIHFRDRRSRVWRRENERYVDPNVQPHDRFGGGSVMVWGGITVTGRTALHIVQGRVTGQYYRDNILEPIVVPFARQAGPQFVFQDDNARAHRARIVTQYLQQQNITTLPWPALSPDLSPIEHVWDTLGRRRKQRQRQPTTVQELGVALQEEWNRIPQIRLGRLIRSMPRRIRACLANRGGFTRY